MKKKKKRALEQNGIVSLWTFIMKWGLLGGSLQGVVSHNAIFAC